MDASLLRAGYLNIMALLAVLVSPASAAKPVLEVWTSTTCLPCIKFWRDYRGDPSLRRALDAFFDVREKVAAENCVEGKLKMVFRVPTFLTDRVRVEGYTSGEDLLARLGLQRVSPPPARPPSTPPSPPAPQPGFDRTMIRTIIREELRFAVQEIKGEPGPQGEQGPPGPTGPRGEPGPAQWDRSESNTARLADLESRIQALENRPAGKVDVLIKDSGRVVNRHQNVSSGSTVEVDINRFKKGN